MENAQEKKYRLMTETPVKPLAHLPQRHHTVCMERTEGKHHCSEVLGRMQLAMFQRTKRQGREHPHAEGLPEGTSQGNEQHGGRESAP